MRRDYYTRTVEGAADFERHFNAIEDDDFDDLDEEEEDDFDRCGCSDPCCPCSGAKRGTP